MKLEGAFASSQAPESEGEEGKYYSWTEAEVDAALAGTFSARFKQVYGVKRDGDYNGKTILRRFDRITTPPTEADEALMARQRANCWKRATSAAQAGARRQACWPTGTVLPSVPWLLPVRPSTAPDWTAAAVGACRQHRHGSWRRTTCSIMRGPNGRHGAKGFADDYVHMAEAALQLYETTGERRYHRAAKAPGCGRWMREFSGMRRAAVIISPPMAGSGSLSVPG